MSTRRVRVIGIGPGGVDQVTVEAVAAMRSVDWFLVLDKAASVRDGAPDPLVRAREAVLARHVGPSATVVYVDDPPRERRTGAVGADADYRAAVAAWHDARTERVADAMAARPGDVGFLVWGDPAFYDSTLRVLDRVADLPASRTGSGEAVEVNVLPGISALQLLAARHRIVLHEVGHPLHVTTGRALRSAVDAGQRNIVVMLNRDLDELEQTDLAAWSLWWGGNLGTTTERLVTGRVAEVLPQVRAARDRLRAAAGWVMDVYLLRAPEGER
ncbi:precorrin-6A synthase (deacetylating) [Nocardioides sambongensis]|uniref:precorrin-6A synthase (deacetylating) n=1 Tax=Nocardioides sambongensis TaxID=2589074 RepID=UPI00112BBF9F|nr:precorrin-6A synthase (deacetylating) [Nocardioides sambongensis]